jgi:hypothetical protein
MSGPAMAETGRMGGTEVLGNTVTEAARMGPPLTTSNDFVASSDGDASSGPVSFRADNYSLIDTGPSPSSSYREESKKRRKTSHQEQAHMSIGLSSQEQSRPSITKNDTP